MTEDPFAPENLRTPESEGGQAGQAEAPLSLDGIVAQSHADVLREQQEAAEKAENARGKAAQHGRSALQAEQQAAAEQDELAASFRAGHVTHDTLAAHTEQLAGKAESTEDFFAQLAASDPNAVVAGGAERGDVKGGLREQSAYGSQVQVQDVEAAFDHDAILRDERPNL